MLPIGPAGPPFRNLPYLEAVGVSVLVEQGRLETLRSLLARKLPPIVFVTTQELLYYTEAARYAVVIAGMDDLQVQRYDPAFSDTPRTIPVDEFALSWLEMDEFCALIQAE